MDNFEQNKHSAQMYEKDIVRSLRTFFGQYMVHQFQFALEFNDKAELTHFQRTLSAIKHWENDEIGGEKIAELFEDITSQDKEICSNIEMYLHLHEHMLRQAMFGNSIPVKPARPTDCAMLFYKILQHMCVVFLSKTHLFDWTSTAAHYQQSSANWENIQKLLRKSILDVLQQSIRKPTKDDLVAASQQERKRVLSSVDYTKPAPQKPEMLKPHESVLMPAFQQKPQQHKPHTQQPTPDKSPEKSPEKSTAKSTTTRKEVKRAPPKPSKKKPVMWKSSYKSSNGEDDDAEPSESDEASGEEDQDDEVSESEAVSGGEEENEDDEEELEELEEPEEPEEAAKEQDSEGDEEEAEDDPDEVDDDDYEEHREENEQEMADLAKEVAELTVKKPKNPKKKELKSKQ